MAYDHIFILHKIRKKKMVRAPCCDNLGLLKKGPWSPEEDRLLVSYIQQHGHDNWRKLPQKAGLSRCGKSCRLRWINYLRPDVKRGNFSEEEMETIIKLHKKLGNKWSVIAGSLPGRTDNEIKNIWNTQLKKRLKSNLENMVQKEESGSQVEDAILHKEISSVENELLQNESSHDEFIEIGSKFDDAICDDDDDDAIEFWYKLLIRAGGFE